MFPGVSREPPKMDKELDLGKTTRLSHPDNNPCLKEQNMSYKCLEDNDYDKNACAVYFENYRSCKKFWNGIRIQRKRAGIVPHMPPAEEREPIRKKFMESMK